MKKGGNEMKRKETMQIKGKDSRKEKAKIREGKGKENRKGKERKRSIASIDV